jgi:hypothetical protein
MRNGTNDIENLDDEERGARYVSTDGAESRGLREDRQVLFAIGLGGHLGLS